MLSLKQTTFEQITSSLSTLNQQVQIVDHVVSENALVLNTAKCDLVMIVSKKSSDASCSIIINDQPLCPTGNCQMSRVLVILGFISILNH